MGSDLKMKDNIAAVYRINIGANLKKNRIEKNFSIQDIVEMTGISKSTVMKIEKGEAKDIDNYVEYAKAVQYPLETLLDFNIKLVPLKQLSAVRVEATKLTSKIRRYIINSNFLIEGKSIADIRSELIKINQINKNVKSVNIAGVMRNLSEDSVIRKEKVGRNNLYFKIVNK